MPCSSSGDPGSNPRQDKNTQCTACDKPKQRFKANRIIFSSLPVTFWTEMKLLDQTRIFCVLFCTSFSFTAAATTSGGANTSALWPDYARFGYASSALVHGLNPAIPITYFETIIDSADVNINGYLFFGPEYTVTAPPTPTKWPQAPKILAAYWADVFNNDPSSLPKVYTYMDETRLSDATRESSLINYVKKVIAVPDFEPLMAISATWVDARPRQRDKFPNDTATFQLLLATDSRVTYAIRGYGQVWQSPELGVLTYYSAAYSRARGERLKLGSPGNYPGPEVIPLGTKAPNKDPYNCVQKAIPAYSRLKAAYAFLPACPCYMKQAAKEPQLKVSDAFPGCYQSTMPPQGDTLLQLCCYNPYGILVNLTKEARVPLSTNSSDRTLQEAYETCCAEGSGLCRWFLLNTEKQECVNNMTLLSTTELPRFTDPVKVVKITASPTQPYFKQFGTNKTPVTYAASGVFNSSHGFIFEPTGRLEWRVSDGLSELKKLSYPQQLVIYATDSDNISAQFGTRYDLCLCQQISQCIDLSFPDTTLMTNRELPGYTGPDTYERGNVNLLYCDCKGNATGRFCENPLNACDDCLITNASVCNTNPQDYCPPCPFGYHRDGTQCRDNSTTPMTPGKGNSIYLISPAQVCVVIILSFLSTYLPWLQNSQPITFN